MYTKKAHIHFVGIGGIGMSGIATILKHQGYTISGCDPDITQDTVIQLKKIGCQVYHGNNGPKCADASIDILVYIPMYANTIAPKTAEINAARRAGIPTISRALMLAELMRTKYRIAIAGAHGKTTTTSLIAHILIEAALDPTVVIGGKLKNLSSNARLGSGDFLVAEADESDRSFLQLHATLAVITNIDLEHLETYKDLDDIKQAFTQFINNLPIYGKAIVCIDDENIQSLLPFQHVKTITYGIHEPADISAQNIILNSDHSLFTIYAKNNSLGVIKLAMPGLHNVYNALGAIALTLELGIDFETITQSLASFGGVERRFSFHGTYRGAEIFDDYGHHPKEIEYCLATARKRSKNKVVVVFQPHRYTRTEKLWHDFVSTFAASAIDTLIITDIYSAGEPSIDGVTSKKLAQELQALNCGLHINYIPYDDTFTLIKDAINASIEQDDLVLLLGAGKMHLIAQELI